MTSTESGQAPQSKSDDLNRVREILFGAEQQRTAKRLHSIEQRMNSEIQSLRKELADQQQRFADDIRKQLAALKDEKLDRHDLADMLGGMLTRLTPSTNATNG